MENSLNTQLAQYYRELEMVQKSLSTQASKTNQPKKVATFLKSKSTFINGIGKQTVINGGQKEKKLSIRANYEQKKDNNQSYYTGIPLKYLVDLNESQISNKKASCSSLSNEENQRIVLQINEQSAEQASPSKLRGGQAKNYSEPNLMSLKVRASIKYRKQEIGRPVDSYQEAQITEGSKKLVKQLSHRNQVYEIVRKNIKGPNPDYTREWEKTYNRYLLYQKFVQKLRKFGRQIE